MPIPDRPQVFSQPSSEVPVVFLDDDPLLRKSRERATDSPRGKRPPAEENGPREPGERLVSLDAYRGFVMLAMASGALGFAKIVDRHGADPEIAQPEWWNTLWQVLAYQFSHVPWVGCSFWDLIQPSFMFIVGVAMPFSFARREAAGEGRLKRFAHVVGRACILIALGVFLSSNGSKFTNFTFVNVLTQIGLGYAFVYLLLGVPWVIQFFAAAAILGGYWALFYYVPPPEKEAAQVKQYIEAHQPNQRQINPADHLAADRGSFDALPANRWNKHTNTAAMADRWLLNQLPQNAELWAPEAASTSATTDAPAPPKRFWVNTGGYQTLNFVPSMATMLFGVMAGQLLLGPRRRKTLWLVASGAACFAVVMALDTAIWPYPIDGCNWSLCPTVKRIWTPTWAVFSTGWTLWLLAAFYWVIDVRKIRGPAFPLVVVGMNSIAMYTMAQLMKPWIARTLQTHLTTLSPNLWTNLFGDGNVYGEFCKSLAVLFVLWLICLWLYRRKIFIRI